MTRWLKYPSATNSSLVFGYTNNPAGPPTFSVSLLPRFLPACPICMRNFPLFVNFRIWLSSFAFPLSQTLSLLSTKIGAPRQTIRILAPGRPAPEGTFRSYRIPRPTEQECSIRLAAGPVKRLSRHPELFPGGERPRGDRENRQRARPPVRSPTCSVKPRTRAGP